MGAGRDARPWTARLLRIAFFVVGLASTTVRAGLEAAPAPLLLFTFETDHAKLPKAGIGFIDQIEAVNQWSGRVQELPTHGSRDAEFSTLNGEGLLVVGNEYSNTTLYDQTLDVYTWDRVTSAWVPPTIPQLLVPGVRTLELFVRNDDVFVATASPTGANAGGTVSIVRIGSFVPDLSISHSFSTTKPHSVDFFRKDGADFLAVASFGTEDAPNEEDRVIGGITVYDWDEGEILWARAIYSMSSPVCVRSFLHQGATYLVGVPGSQRELPSVFLEFAGTGLSAIHALLSTNLRHSEVFTIDSYLYFAFANVSEPGTSPIYAVGTTAILSSLALHQNLPTTRCREITHAAYFGRHYLIISHLEPAIYLFNPSNRQFGLIQSFSRATHLQHAAAFAPVSPIPRIFLTANRLSGTSAFDISNPSLPASPWGVGISVSQTQEVDTSETLSENMKPFFAFVNVTATFVVPNSTLTGCFLNPTITLARDVTTFVASLGYAPLAFLADGPVVNGLTLYEECKTWRALRDPSLTPSTPTCLTTVQVECILHPHLSGFRWGLALRRTVNGVEFEVRQVGEPWHRPYPPLVRYVEAGFGQAVSIEGKSCPIIGATLQVVGAGFGRDPTAHARSVTVLGQPCAQMDLLSPSELLCELPVVRVAHVFTAIAGNAEKIPPVIPASVIVDVAGRKGSRTFNYSVPRVESAIPHVPPASITQITSFVLSGSFWLPQLATSVTAMFVSGFRCGLVSRVDDNTINCANILFEAGPRTSNVTYVLSGATVVTWLGVLSMVHNITATGLAFSGQGTGTGGYIVLDGTGFGSDSQSPIASISVGPFPCENVAVTRVDTQLACLLRGGIGANLPVSIETVFYEVITTGLRYSFLPPSISHVEPNSILPGARPMNFTVHGANLGSNSTSKPSVLIIGGITCPRIVFLNATAVECWNLEVPLAGWTSSSVSVIVGGQAGSLAGAVPTIHPGPRANLLGTSSTSTGGPNVLTLEGTNFGPVGTSYIANVTVGPYQCAEPRVIVAGTTLNCTLDGGIGANLPIYFTTVFGTSYLSPVTFMFGAPVIHRLVPDSVLPGQRVFTFTFLGENFGRSATERPTVVDIGGTLCSVIVFLNASAFECRDVVMPFGGWVSPAVLVQVSELFAYVSHLAPRVRDSPVMSSYSVSNTSTDGPNVFAIVGSDFGPVGTSYIANVTVGPYTCHSPVVVVEHTQLNCTVYGGIGGGYRLSMTTVYGLSHTSTFSFNFNAPSIFGMLPSSLFPGERLVNITVLGRDFGPSVYETADLLKVGYQTCAAIGYINSSALECRNVQLPPSGSWGSISVTVRVGNYSVTANGINPVIRSAPALTSVSSTTTSIEGPNMLFIFGTDFGPIGSSYIANVFVGTFPCLTPVVESTDTMLSCTLEGGAGRNLPVVFQTVYSVNSTGTVTFSFSGPRVHRVEPSRFVYLGARLVNVTIYGSDVGVLRIGPKTSVVIGGSPCEHVKVINASCIQCIDVLLPSDGWNNSDVVVNVGGQTRVAENVIEMDATPYVLSVHPSVNLPLNAPTSVTVRGINFITPVGHLTAIRFGDVDCADLVFDRWNLVNCTIHGGTGVNLPALARSDTSEDWSVTTTRTLSFRTPVVDRAEPEKLLFGPKPGLVRIWGSNLGRRNGSFVGRVLIAGEPCADVHLVSPELLECRDVTLPSLSRFGRAPLAEAVIVEATWPGQTFSFPVSGVELLEEPEVELLTLTRLPTATASTLSFSATRMVRTDTDITGIFVGSSIWCSNHRLFAVAGSVLVECDLENGGIGAELPVIIQLATLFNVTVNGSVSFERPRVTAIEPSYVLGGDRNLTFVVRGQSFGTTTKPTAVAVWVGGVACSHVRPMGDGLLLCVNWPVPLVEEPSSLSLLVHCSVGGQSAVESVSLRMYSAPGVDSVAIAEGKNFLDPSGNTTLVLTVSYWGEVVSDIGSITVGDSIPCVDATMGVVPSVVQCVVQGGRGHSLAVTFTSRTGRRSVAEQRVSFRPPTLVGLSPFVIQQTASDTEVVILGSAFGHPTDPNIQVFIGDYACSVTHVSDTLLRCLVRNVPVGAHFVVVNTTSGSSLSTGTPVTLTVRRPLVVARRPVRLRQSSAATSALFTLTVRDVDPSIQLIDSIELLVTPVASGAAETRVACVPVSVVGTLAEAELTCSITTPLPVAAVPGWGRFVVQTRRFVSETESDDPSDPYLLIGVADATHSLSVCPAPVLVQWNSSSSSGNWSFNHTAIRFGSWALEELRPESFQRPCPGNCNALVGITGRGRPDGHSYLLGQSTSECGGLPDDNCWLSGGALCVEVFVPAPRELAVEPCGSLVHVQWQSLAPYPLPPLAHAEASSDAPFSAATRALWPSVSDRDAPPWTGLLGSARPSRDQWEALRAATVVPVTGFHVDVVDVVTGAVVANLTISENRTREVVLDGLPTLQQLQVRLSARTDTPSIRVLSRWSPPFELSSTTTCSAVSVFVRRHPENPVRLPRPPAEAEWDTAELQRATDEPAPWLSLVRPRGDVALDLPVRPIEGEQLTVSCGPDARSAGRLSVTPSSVQLTSRNWTTSSTVRVWFRVDALAWSSATASPPTAWESVGVSCAIASWVPSLGDGGIYRGVPVLNGPFLLVPDRWPLLQDVFTPVSVPAPPATSQDAEESSPATRPSTIVWESTAAAMQTRGAVVAGSSSPFDVTVSSGSTLVLAGRGGAAPTPPFVSGVRVCLGGVPMPVRAISSNGRLLLVEVPGFADVCGASGAQCATPADSRRVLSVHLPSTLPVDATVESTASLANWTLGEDATSISIPTTLGEGRFRVDGVRWLRVQAGNSLPADPCLPVDFTLMSDASAAPTSPSRLLQWRDGVRVVDDDSVLAASQLPWNTTFGRSLHCPPTCPEDPEASLVPESVLLEREAAALAAPSSAWVTGFFFTKGCDGYRNDSATCLNPATASQCAYGSGLSCRPCPEGGLCPGGFRLWAQPGYWLSGETSVDLMKCSAPSVQRCEGWDVVRGATRCGSAFQNDSTACSLCANEFYPEKGSCSECPNANGDDGVSESVLISLAVVFGSVVGVAAVTLLAIFIVFRRSGRPLNEGMAQVAQLVIWTITVLQVVAQAGRTASSNLPSFMKGLYEILFAFQLDFSVVVHPACMHIYPFITPVVVFSVELTLVLLIVGAAIPSTCFLKRTLAGASAPPASPSSDAGGAVVVMNVNAMAKRAVASSPALKTASSRASIAIPRPATPTPRPSMAGGSPRLESVNPMVARSRTTRASFYPKPASSTSGTGPTAQAGSAQAVRERLAASPARSSRLSVAASASPDSTLFTSSSDSSGPATSMLRGEGAAILPPGSPALAAAASPSLGVLATEDARSESSRRMSHVSLSFAALPAPAPLESSSSSPSSSSSLDSTKNESFTKRRGDDAGWGFQIRLWDLQRLWLLGATVLFPLALNNALDLVNCFVPAGGTQPVLVSNHFMACWRGDHTLVGILAIVTLVVVGVLFVAVGWAWVFTVVRHVQRDGDRLMARASAETTKWMAALSAALTARELRLKRAGFRFENLGLVAALGLVSNPWLGTTSSVRILATAIVQAVVLVAFALWTALRKPYRGEHAWKTAVKSASLVVGAAAVMLNGVGQESEHAENDSLDSAIRALAVLTFAGALLMFVVLLVAFWATILRAVKPGTVAQTGSEDAKDLLSQTSKGPMSSGPSSPLAMGGTLGGSAAVFGSEGETVSLGDLLASAWTGLRAQLTLARAPAPTVVRQRSRASLAATLALKANASFAVRRASQMPRRPTMAPAGATSPARSTAESGGSAHLLQSRRLTTVLQSAMSTSGIGRPATAVASSSVNPSPAPAASKRPLPRVSTVVRSVVAFAPSKTKQKAVTPRAAPTPARASEELDE